MRSRTPALYTLSWLSLSSHTLSSTNSRLRACTARYCCTPAQRSAVADMGLKPHGYYHTVALDVLYRYADEEYEHLSQQGPRPSWKRLVPEEHKHLLTRIKLDWG